jgi:23S rRNA (adenine1618-N6)-methyltransferase
MLTAITLLFWVQDLLQTQSNLSRPARVIDLGVGANIVYPMLGIRATNWGSVLGLDCDPAALQIAAANVQATGLSDRVQLRLVRAPQLPPRD